MNYYLMLSLKDISLRRVAIILWGRTEINDWLIRDGIDHEAERVAKKLMLPENLTYQLINLVDSIQTQITTWRIFNYKQLSIENNSPPYVQVIQHFCWTVLGTIDYRKSAEKLIRLEMFDNVILYKLACLYCLETCIPVLWEKLSEECKINFFKKARVLEIIKTQLEFCWPYIIKGETATLDYILGRTLRTPTTFTQHAFESQAYKGNKIAAEYFFRKLTNSEREVTLLNAAKKVLIGQRDMFPFKSLFARFSDTFIYLLTQMSPEEQKKTFKEDPCTVLTFFYEWPWQDLFLNLAELIRPFISINDYHCFLVRVYSQRRLIQKEFFQKFFHEASYDFKKEFVGKECRCGIFFRNIFELQDSELVKIVFKNIDPGDRNRLVSSNQAFKRIYKAVSRGKKNLVELFLLEADLTKEETESLKEKFFGFLEHYDTENIKRKTNVSDQCISIFAQDKSKCSIDNSLLEEDLIYPSTDSESDDF